MPRTATLSDRAADVLAAAEATATTVRLPDGQLDWKVYLEVNEALSRIAGGGKWNRKQRVHLFTRDPRDELAALCEAGIMPADQDKLMSFFPTPAPLVHRMVKELATQYNGFPTVLEPSAGDGAIAAHVRLTYPHARIDAIEPNPERYTAMVKAARPDRSACATFEAFLKTKPQPVYTAIVMNPPFTLPKRSLAWLDHLCAAWTLLAPGGRLVAIVPASFAHRETPVFDAARNLVAEHGQFEHLADDTFKASGTGVRTCQIVMDKPK